MAALQKIITLEKLCRALQEERTLMQIRLKMNTEPDEEEKEDSVPNGEA